MLTLCPDSAGKIKAFNNCTGSFRLIQMTGNGLQVFSLNRVSCKGIHDLDLEELLRHVPSFRERKDIASHNPYEAARYFDFIMNLVISEILAWDKKSQCCKPKPGLFGFTKAFCAATESQNSGNLHSHIIIWIHGLPETSMEFDKMKSKEPELLIDYCTSILSNDLPMDLSIQCPNCEIDLQEIH
jgi:hypothetical protein